MQRAREREGEGEGGSELWPVAVWLLFRNLAVCCLVVCSSFHYTSFLCSKLHRTQSLHIYPVIMYTSNSLVTYIV